MLTRKCYCCNFTIVAIVPFNSRIYTDLRIVGPAIDVGVQTMRNKLLPKCGITFVVPKERWQGSCDEMESELNDYVAKLFYDKINGLHPVGVFVGVTCTFANKVFLDQLHSKFI